MIFKFAFRDIVRHWRFTLFFVFNLTIGLTGFVTLETFKNALQDHLQSNAKSILSADIAIEARRDLTEKELQVLKKIPSTENSVVYDFFAMATALDQSKLVSVKSIDSHFPMYGALVLKNGKKANVGNLELLSKAWVSPEILEQFGVRVGDHIKLGLIEFTIDDVIEKDSTQTFRSATLAPRVYIHLNQLKATGLIQYGSTFSKEWLFKLKEGSDVGAIKENIYRDIIDPSVRVQTPETASEDAGQQLNYLSDYLGLVTLVALFLSALGAAYLFRLYIQDKIKDIAILRSLGMRTNDALKVYLIQTLFLGVIAIIFSFLLTLMILPLVKLFLISFLPFPLELNFSERVFFVGFCLAVFGSVSISLPYLLKIRQITVSQLFSEEHFQTDFGRPRWLALVPALILFLFLSIYQSHSYKIGIGFSLGMLAALLILGSLALIFINLVTRIPFKNWSLRFSFLALKRKKISALALFISLALGALLINVLPQLKITLQNSMNLDKGSVLPSLFVFDVQDDQIDKLKNFLKEHQFSIFNFSPMIRSRILKVNGLDFERKLDIKNYKTREEEREARFRNRGVNLTYRDKLTASEEIREGKPFSGKLDPNMAELSVEFRYADRLGFKLGDEISFDIQGLEVKGRIVNFRSVQWTSFQPNFFIIMQSGFLEEAPKTFIGSLPRIANNEKLNLQRELSKEFSNISIVDVDHLVTDILNMAEQMSLSLELMALLSILAGYVVLYSIVRTQVQSRRWELNMLKILGAKQYALNSYILVEVFVVTFLASLTGAFLSLVASSIISRVLFENSLKPNLIWIFTSVICISFLSLIIAWFAARQVMKDKPYHILTDLN
jgi:putative ABC transport system permease protein